MRHARFADPDLARVPHVAPSYRLRYGSFDSGPLAVALFEVRAGLPCAGGRQRLILLLGPDGNRPPGPIRTRRVLFATPAIAGGNLIWLTGFLRGSMAGVHRLLGRSAGQVAHRASHSIRKS